MGPRTEVANEEKHLYLVLNEFTNKLFGTIHNAEKYQYHALLPPEKIIQSPNYAMSDLLDEARLNIVLVTNFYVGTTKTQNH